MIVGPNGTVIGTYDNRETGATGIIVQEPEPRNLTGDYAVGPKLYRRWDPGNDDEIPPNF
jgi:hypothetical protein